MSRNGWIALLAGLVISCLCLSMCSGVFIIGTVISRNASTLLPALETSSSSPRRTIVPTNTPRPVQRNPLPTARVTGTPSTSKVTPIAPVVTTVDITGKLPREDLADLAIRFKGVSPQQAFVTCTVQAKGFDVGATRKFILSDQDASHEFTITAQLKYKTAYAYMWVETSPVKLNINQNNLQKAGDVFNDKILATNRAFFGNEKLGPDCDPHLNVLHASGVGSTVGGYFSSPDVYPRAVRQDSNEAKMFVVNAAPGYNGADPGSSSYMSTLAHELQHMISFDNVHASALWLEEGAAQLAERLNGYADEVGTVYTFASAPDTQLTTWSEGSAGENTAHYGAGYLFWSYLYDRFGTDTVQKLVQTKERSIPAVMAVLADAGVTNPDTGKPYIFDDLFADWVVANYMGSQKIDKTDKTNRYNYTDTKVPPMTTYTELSTADYPYDSTDQVNQYGTHYIELKGNKKISIDFAGTNTTPILPSEDTGGAVWWSNRADASNPRLTREFDLTKVKAATLSFRAWYRLEVDYDYGYVSISTDNGATWKIQKSSTCVITNPNGGNLGCGYSGSSGGENSPQWLDETVDLSPFAGKKILLRFETVTDAGVNREGLAINNVEIPEIGFKDSPTDTTWKSEGFVRVDNLIAQAWRVQLIVTHKDNHVTLERVSLDNNAASTILDFSSASGDVRSAILAISAVAPVVTEPGSYELSIK